MPMPMLRDSRCKQVREPGYSTTLLGDAAVKLINDHDPKTPLFLDLAFNAPHAPYQAPEKKSHLFLVLVIVVLVLLAGLGFVFRPVREWIATRGAGTSRPSRGHPSTEPPPREDA